MLGYRWLVCVERYFPARPGRHYREDAAGVHCDICTGGVNYSGMQCVEPAYRADDFELDGGRLRSATDLHAPRLAVGSAPIAVGPLPMPQTR